MEESEDGLEEWRDLVMSPNGLSSGFSKSFADVSSGGEGVLGVNLDKGVENSMLGYDGKMEGCENGLNSFIVAGGSVGFRTGGSIAERRAAKFGFNAAKISNPRFRSSSPLPSPGVRSPYLTIPPGISPTALLDSPIMVSNPQPSPTTGTFASPPLDEGNQMLISASRAETDKCSDDGSSAMVKPRADSIPLAHAPGAENEVCSTSGLAQSLVAHLERQSLTSMNLPMDIEFPMQIPEVTVNDNNAGLQPGGKISSNPTMNDNSTTLQPCQSDTVAHVQMKDKNKHSAGEDSGTCDSLGEDQKGTNAPSGTLRNAEDGYNWRKYGQKQVKGSEYPRSYYKCTHQNCQVKKKVEHAHDGQITEIIYKGAHNHPKPQPSGKPTFGSSLSFSETSDTNKGSGSSVKADGGTLWRNIQPGTKIETEWTTDGLERTSSISVVTEVSDKLSSNQGKLMGVLESAGTPEFSSTLASHEDDEEDAGTQGSFSFGDDDENEPHSKRRRKEACFIETTLGSRAVREPKVVVQIESDVDILDDGYRWRKYGQKVVKGNPNPRSYYKCTNAGCTVRKHVERASQNFKCVITTYEGKHNHEVPAAKNSSHANSGSGSLPPPGINSQSPLTLSRHPHLPKAEPHVHDLPPHFGRKMECNNDFLRLNFLGNSGGANTPYYHMRFPPLSNTMPYDPFGLSNDHRAYPGGIGPPIPELSFPLPMGLPQPSSLSIMNYNNPERPLSSGHPLFAGHRVEENNAKLLKPKEERSDDSFYDTRMQDTDCTNSSLSSIDDYTARLFPS